MNDVASIALAVTSGRADAMVTAVFGALVAKNRNPDLGDFVLPTPTVYLPSYVGLRREDNNTLQKFLQAWAEWNNLLGYTEARIKKWGRGEFERRMREWGKLGGRPIGSGKQPTQRAR